MSKQRVNQGLVKSPYVLYGWCEMSTTSLFRIHLPRPGAQRKEISETHDHYSSSITPTVRTPAASTSILAFGSHSDVFALPERHGERVEICPGRDCGGLT